VPAPRTIGELLQLLFPHGTTDQAVFAVTPEQQQKLTPTWDSCPSWPADVFAFAATLVELSDCHTMLAPTLFGGPPDRREEAVRKHLERNDRLRGLGKDWAAARSGVVTPPEPVAQAWTRLATEFADQRIVQRVRNGRLRSCDEEALFLLAVADEAARGFGWGHVKKVDGRLVADPETSYLARFLYGQFIQGTRGRSRSVAPGEGFWQYLAPLFLRRLPNTICSLVPRHVACVLPKNNTPQFGCTLRALSHHLALLPGIGVAEAAWDINAQWRDAADWRTEEDPGALRLLIVPFPYVVRAGDFAITRPPVQANGGTVTDGEFAMRPEWLSRTGAGRRVTGKDMAQFLLDAIQAAMTEVKRIDIVVLPELALTEAVAREMATHIAANPRAPGMIITGTSNEQKKSNQAVVYLLDRGQVLEDIQQSKHHRWRLDGNQIRSYNLGDPFNPRHGFWEDIEIHDRRLRFAVNRQNEVIAALVCEDLARNDPVQPLLAAIGPSLVVALLQDAAQLPARWPGRYATVLADDPGSSVLTLTSAGMVARSHGGDGPLPNHGARLSIALWRQPGEPARELVLPRDHHALLLCLSSRKVPQKTLDLREDTGIALDLSAVREIRVANEPAWLRREPAPPARKAKRGAQRPPASAPARRLRGVER